MIPLVVLDLDGTVIGADAQVRNCVWEAVNRGREAGMKVSICTGRPAFGVAQRIAEKIGPDNPHVFQSGAHIGYPDGRTLEVTALREDDILALIRLARETGALLELYTPSELFVGKRTDLAERHAKLLGVTSIVRDLENVARNEPVVRAQWVTPWGDHEPLLEGTPEGISTATATSPALPGIAFVNLTRSGTSKASAVKLVAKHLRVPLKDIMAVGDSENDVPMLDVVGHPRVRSRRGGEDGRGSEAHGAGDRVRHGLSFLQPEAIMGADTIRQ